MKKIMMKKSKGQGVIEYAGALVIAAVLVSVVLVVGPDQMEAIFNQIFETVSTMLEDGLAQTQG